MSECKRGWAVTPTGAPVAASLVLGPPLDQLVKIAKRRISEYRRVGLCPSCGCSDCEGTMDWELLGISHTELETMNFIRQLQGRPAVRACSWCGCEGYLEEDCPTCEGEGQIENNDACDESCEECGGKGCAYFECSNDDCEGGQVKILCKDCRGRGYIEDT